MRVDVYSENTKKLLFSCFKTMKYQRKDYYIIHHHAELELGYICSGEGTFAIGEQTFQGKKGDLFLMRPNEQHCIPVITTPQFEYYTLHITSYFLWNVCSEYLKKDVQHLLFSNDVITHKFANKGHFIEQIKKICELDEQSLTENLGKIRFLVLSLFESFTDDLMLLTNDKNKSTLPYYHLDEVQRAVQHINENFTEDITLERLAKYVNLSKTYFSVIFKQATGIAPYDYLILRRIERALELLRYTNDSIVDISGKCGFNSLSNFNRRFKNATGMSPKEYRNIKSSTE